MVFFPLRAFTLFSLLTLFATTVVNGTPAVKRDSRTSAPSGAVVVRGSGTKSGEYSTVQAAVNSLASDGTAKVIFIYAGKSIFLWVIKRVGMETERFFLFLGTYSEQVYIDRKGKTTVCAFS